jgi:hypothetical protein
VASRLNKIAGYATARPMFVARQLSAQHSAYGITAFIIVSQRSSSSMETFEILRNPRESDHFGQKNIVKTFASFKHVAIRTLHAMCAVRSLLFSASAIQNLNFSAVLTNVKLCRFYFPPDVKDYCSRENSVYLRRSQR